MAKTHVAPVRFTFMDQDLGCRVMRGGGHRATCECGKDSGRVSTVREARDWLRAHRREAHP